MLVGVNNSNLTTISNSGATPSPNLIGAGIGKLIHIGLSPVTQLVGFSASTSGEMTTITLWQNTISGASINATYSRTLKGQNRCNTLFFVHRCKHEEIDYPLHPMQ